MSLINSVLSKGNDFPIKTNLPVHSGKVRSVYWLNQSDSKRLIHERGYDVSEDSDLAVMIITDRISAFDFNWKTEGNVSGIPCKGAALNAISAYWFDLFRKNGLAKSHILESPHPLVWIVQKAQPVLIEAIARQYITGSMWRAYAKGEREFSGYKLPEELQKNQQLSSLLITPSTKGILKNIPGVPEVDDCTISRSIIENHYQSFNFRTKEDIQLYEKLLTEGFDLVSNALKQANQILVDTKFEFGYAKDAQGNQNLIYMDEVGTPDSSRFWSIDDYQQGKVVEKSKEIFRQRLLNYVAEPDILTNSERMQERKQLAEKTVLPVSIFYELSEVYKKLVKDITSVDLAMIHSPRESIIDILKNEFDLIEQ